MTDLPAYTGPNVKCPKCEVGKVRTTFHASGRTVDQKTPRGEYWECANSRIGQHLCRDCPNCGYAWAEACADSRDGETGKQ